jgi:pyridinium-3,5-bisthiocarboxylic acid mononucleotide nickel chelatase
VKKALHFDCVSGAAGDMILGALIDAGAPVTKIKTAIEGLGLSNWDVEVQEVTRAGLRATRVIVRVEGDDPPRSYSDIVGLLRGARLDDRVRRRALKTFELLGSAEARVHRVPVEEVHLHEVGATDALIDLVGACAAIEHFRPATITASPVATGTGIVATDHGPLPLPAPAVAELLTGVPVFSRGTAELITPTGAAILRAACDSFGEMPQLVLDKTGYGAGQADHELPNVVRVFVGDALGRPRENAVVLETNIDDMSPEILPHVIERLLAAGAHDAWTTPIVMKKGRAATTLSVLCDNATTSAMIDVIFAETTTLGVRATTVAKHTLGRHWVEVDVEGHPIRVKLGSRDGAVVSIAPEYDDARAVALATGRPLREIYERATHSVRARAKGL